MSEDKLPTEVSRGTIEVFPGLELTVVQLDNGQREILAEDLQKFVSWLEEAAKLAGWEAIYGKRQA